ncbi:UNVERIFIED_CONTAM: hypothetical protein FKN15_013485 [Acipenser sinensis]
MLAPGISLFSSLAHQHTQRLRCWLRGSTIVRPPQRISMTTVWIELSRVVHTYKGHNAEVHLLQPFGDHVISVDRDNVVVIWDVQSEEEYLQLNFDKMVFAVSAIMHPSTYLNKILLGSEQGGLQLWNVKSNKLLYTFSGWGSGVTVLQQAPAVDVIAVGLASGQIVIHNIKCDESLMKFQQDWGPITAISFRTDGHPVMAAGSPVGHIGLWDLDDKKLISQMRNAHTTAIAGMTFVHGEPLLITNGADNAIRVWIFDAPGGGGRLLRSRMGHSAPPTKIQHHGQNGQQILSAGQDGTLQSFSTVHERFNKSLGRGSINKKKSKKKGLQYDTMKLPPITAFASETARQSDWDGIIACHRGYLIATTWNYQKTSMGAYKLEPERFHKDRGLNVHATAVDITSCGNFGVVALSTGHIDVYNMQSGMHRGQYGKEKAHEGPVRGVAVDGLNQLTISVGADRLIKFWKFKSKELVHTATLSSSPASMLLHRDRGAIFFDLFDIASWTHPGGYLLTSGYLIETPGMLKVTMPSSRTGAASEYWIDGSNKEETLADYYELESELGRFLHLAIQLTCSITFVSLEMCPAASSGNAGSANADSGEGHCGNGNANSGNAGSGSAASSGPVASSGNTSSGNADSSVRHSGNADSGNADGSGALRQWWQHWPIQQW